MQAKLRNQSWFYSRHFSKFAPLKLLPMEHTRRNKIVDLMKSKEYGSEVLVKGWVRTKRGNKNINFIAVNDGSVIHHIQVVAEVANFPEEI